MLLRGMVMLTIAACFVYYASKPDTTGGRCAAAIGSALIIVFGIAWNATEVLD